MKRFVRRSLAGRLAAASVALLLGPGLGTAEAGDLGPRHHAKGQYDTVTATYVVAEGDELISIGERFQIPLAALKKENRLDSDTIRVGQTLKLPGADAPALPALEPKAVDLLKAMSARLAGAESLSFRALTTYEYPSRIGPPLAYTSLSDVLVQRPDKLKVITVGDGPASEFYYDGKTAMAYSPAEDLVAVAEAPPTLDAMLEAAFVRAAIYFPFTDLILADPYKDMADGLVHAFYIGQSKVVGGVLTDMVGLADRDVFVQIWIGAEDKLPRMMRAVYRADPLRLRSAMELSDWNIDPTAAPGAFGSSKANEAKRIDFAHPRAPVPGAGPSAASSNESK